MKQNKLSKLDLISKIAGKSNISKSDASRILDDIQDIIITEVSYDTIVTLPKLGIFQTKIRKARTGLNPFSGEKIKIPEKRVPGFKASKHFKDEISIKK